MKNMYLTIRKELETMKKMENDIINPALMLAISRMKENNNLDTQNRMVEEALNARFLVPCVVHLKPGTEKETKRTPANTVVNFNMVKSTEGIMFFIAFSDMGELKKWQDNENQNVMVMSFDELANLVQGAGEQSNGFVLNPMTSNVVFQKKIIANIIANRDKAVKEGKIVQVHPEQRADAEGAGEA